MYQTRDLTEAKQIQSRGELGKRRKARGRERERESLIERARTMDAEQIDLVVMRYLKNKGFDSAAKDLEKALHHNNGSSFNSIDYHNDPELTKLIRSFSQ